MQPLIITVRMFSSPQDRIRLIITLVTQFGGEFNDGERLDRDH